MAKKWNDDSVKWEDPKEEIAPSDHQNWKSIARVEREAREKREGRR